MVSILQDLPNDNCLRVCNSSVPSLSHSPDMAADSTVNTWWQSVTWQSYPLPLNITYSISFGKVHQLTDNLIITFNSGKSMIIHVYER